MFLEADPRCVGEGVVVEEGGGGEGVGDAPAAAILDVVPARQPGFQAYRGNDGLPRALPFVEAMPKKDPHYFYVLERGRYQASARKVVLDRDGAMCVACGSVIEVEAAHVVRAADLRKNLDAQGAHDPRLMVALCSSCHSWFDGSVAPEHRQELRDLARRREALGPVGFTLDEYYELGQRMSGLYRLSEPGRARLRESVLTHVLSVTGHPVNQEGLKALLWSVYESFLSRSNLWIADFDDFPAIRQAGTDWSHYFQAFHTNKEARIPNRVQRLLKELPDWREHLAQKEREREQRRAEEADRRIREKADLLAMLRKGPMTVKEIVEAGYKATVATVRNFMETNRTSLLAAGLVERMVSYDGNRKRVAYGLTVTGRGVLRRIGSTGQGSPPASRGSPMA